MTKRQQAKATWDRNWLGHTVIACYDLGSFSNWRTEWWGIYRINAIIALYCKINEIQILIYDQEVAWQSYLRRNLTWSHRHSLWWCPKLYKFVLSRIRTNKFDSQRPYRNKRERFGLEIQKKKINKFPNKIDKMNTNCCLNCPWPFQSVREGWPNQPALKWSFLAKNF